MRSVLLVPLLFLGLAVPDFDTARESAKGIKSLRKAVGALVGDCSGAEYEDAIACQKNQQAAATRLRASDHYINLGIPPEGMLKFEGMRGAKARFLWTPMVDARNGLALTVGKPLKLSSQGQPVMKLKPIDAEVPSDVFDTDILRAGRLGMINVELIGRFGKSWQLGRGDGAVRGVSFQPKLIKFTNARSGKTLGVAKL